METNKKMIIEKTETYTKWFEKQSDVKLIARIQIRLKKLAEENHFGDISPIKPTSYGVFEMRIYYGAGYRLYYKQKNNNSIVLLLCAGSKGTQDLDVERAKQLAKEN
jgi:putative addiction module killer protein